jgi:hypothetical protein
LANAGIIAEIDAEISRLRQARALLVGRSTDEAPKAKRGRPKGSVNKPTTAKTAAKKGKRTLTPESRKAIADAMKRRWAAKRKEQAQ